MYNDAKPVDLTMHFGSSLNGEMAPQRLCMTRSAIVFQFPRTIHDHITLFTASSLPLASTSVIGNAIATEKRNIKNATAIGNHMLRPPLFSDRPCETVSKVAVKTNAGRNTLYVAVAFVSEKNPLSNCPAQNGCEKERNEPFVRAVRVDGEK